MLNGLQPWHLIILVVALVLLFGAKRLPDAARSVGRSMKIFKAETKGFHSEGKSDGEGEKPAEPETRQLPQASATPSTDQQVADLQRQLDELKRQQAERAHKNAG